MMIHLHLIKRMADNIQCIVLQTVDGPDMLQLLEEEPHVAQVGISIE